MLLLDVYAWDRYIVSIWMCLDEMNARNFRRMPIRMGELGMNARDCVTAGVLGHKMHAWYFRRMTTGMLSDKMGTRDLRLDLLFALATGIAESGTSVSNRFLNPIVVVLLLQVMTR